MTQLITIHGVRGYIDENGTAQLNLEDVSRGLGFTQTAASGNEVVRWERVNKYLAEFSFVPTSGDGCIPENIFYRLSMKAKNEAAENFQIKVADEILPSIRKTGSYSIQHQLPQTMPEALRLYAAQIEETEKVRAEKEVLAIENTAQKQQLKEQETPVAIYKLAIAAQNTQSMADVAKALGTGRNRLFDILRDEKIIPLGRTVPYQRYIESGYFVVRERPRASGDTIVNDPVPRVTAKGFDYIARLMQKRSNPGA